MNDFYAVRFRMEVGLPRPNVYEPIPPDTFHDYELYTMTVPTADIQPVLRKRLDLGSGDRPLKVFKTRKRIEVRFGASGSWTWQVLQLLMQEIKTCNGYLDEVFRDQALELGVEVKVFDTPIKGITEVAYPTYLALL